ncbi:hypothetical protein F110043I8_28500 [Ruminococcus sp. f11]|jgi:hypothetical protein
MSQIFRVERTKNYTVMSNHHFKNKSLSLKAKGVLSLMLSLPDNWNYNISISELNRIYEQLEELPDYLLDDLDSFVLAPVSGDYVFSELVNPVFTKDGDNLKVSVPVKYLDNKSKMTQISQYELVLHKDDNWKIVG